MRFIVFVLCICFQFDSVHGQQTGQPNYLTGINEVYRWIGQKNYDEAITRLDSLLANYDYPIVRDIELLSVLSYCTGDKEHLVKSFRELMKAGVDKKYFEKFLMYYPFSDVKDKEYKDSIYQESKKLVMNEFDLLHKIYRENIDSLNTLKYVFYEEAHQYFHDRTFTWRAMGKDSLDILRKYKEFYIHLLPRIKDDIGKLGYPLQKNAMSGIGFLKAKKISKKSVNRKKRKSYVDSLWYDGEWSYFLLKERFLSKAIYTNLLPPSPTAFNFAKMPLVGLGFHIVYDSDTLADLWGKLVINGVQAGKLSPDHLTNHLNIAEQWLAKDKYQFGILGYTYHSRSILYNMPDEKIKLFNKNRKRCGFISIEQEQETMKGLYNLFFNEEIDFYGNQANARFGQRFLLVYFYNYW